MDAAQWGALALGAAVLAWGSRAAAIAHRHERRVVVALAAVAAVLSWGYVHAYLRGGPRIIDATSYYLEARGLAEGHVTWPAGEPETSSLGRFLVRSDSAEGARAAVLFPPGYPLLLALGFLAGAPLAVGPFLAAALVLATYALAREVVRDAPDLAGAPLIAAALSAVCGVLRYHTADTMSHGLAALCFTLGLTFLLRAHRSRVTSPRGAALYAAAAGLFGGWLFATRPVSALAWAATATLAFAAGAPRARSRDLARLGGFLALGALPLSLVWLLHQRAATGNNFLTTHSAHYAQNDGPAGCFRYGFGAGIGCYGEHSDFVRANLPDGFGAIAVVKTTARRLWMHLADAANAEPLAPLVIAGAALAWKRPAARLLAFAVALQIAAYVPFYFDANYPAGGARLYADVLPIEHVLLAIAAVMIAQRSGPIAKLARGSGAWILGLALVGFALRGGFDHAQLRDRDGGAPLFSPAALAAVKAPALVFTETDAAYNLAFDPGARGAGGIDVVRWKGDALDTVAWLERGSPPSFIARFEVASGTVRGRTFLEPYAPEAAPHLLKGASLWPPRAQSGEAFALPVFTGGACAGNERALRIFVGARMAGAVTVALPARAVAGSRVAALLMTLGAAPALRASADLAFFADGVELAQTSFEEAGAAPGAPACARALGATVPAGAHDVTLRIAPRWSSAGGDPEKQPYLALDRITIEAPEAAAGGP